MTINVKQQPVYIEESFETKEKKYKRNMIISNMGVDNMLRTK